MIRPLLARYATPLLAVAVAGVAFGWYRASIHAAEERGKTAVALAQRDSARSDLDSVVKIRQLADSADSVKAVVLARTAQEARKAVRVYAGRIKALQTVNDSLLALGTPTDSLAALAGLIQVNATLREAGAACQVGWAADSAGWSLCRERQARADSTIREGASLLAETERLLQVQTRRASPGVFTRVRQSLPYLGAGLLAGFLLSR